MRKTIFISLFAVAGSICSISHAACMGAATDVTGQTVTLPATAPPARKLLRGGHLLIQQGNNTYTPAGMQLESMRK